jgi:type III secretory pathway component EscU
MMLNMAIAALLMVVNTAIHASGMLLVVRMVLSDEAQTSNRKQRMHLFSVAGVVLLMFLVSVIEVLVWSVTYLWLGAIEGLEKATYFSMVTFTTLGYGEIVLDEQWRLLASFEAANGIIMFGWTTAIVLATVQRIYFNKEV